MQKIVIFLSLFLLILSAQAQSTFSLLETYFQQVRTGDYQPAPKSIWQNPQQAGELLEALAAYHSDTLSTIRAKAYYLTQKIGLESNKPAIRQKAVHDLLAACRDKDTGNSGLSSSYLTSFAPADFNAAAKDQLRELLLLQPPHYPRILKLAGYAVLSDQIPLIQDKLSSGVWTGRNKWAASLALARMGEQQAISYCVNFVSRFPVNDDVVYELLPELVYTRQPQAIAYLVDILYSHELNCESADPEASENILCAYRVLELLAPVIADFPLKTDGSGDLAVGDYEAALQQVRDWFSMKGNRYIIRQDTF